MIFINIFIGIHPYYYHGNINWVLYVGRMESFFVQEGVVLSVMFGQIAGKLLCNVVIGHSLCKIFLF